MTPVHPVSYPIPLGDYCALPASAKLQVWASSPTSCSHDLTFSSRWLSPSPRDKDSCLLTPVPLSSTCLSERLFLLFCGNLIECCTQGRTRPRCCPRSPKLIVRTCNARTLTPDRRNQEKASALLKRSHQSDRSESIGDQTLPATVD